MRREDVRIKHYRGAYYGFSGSGKKTADKGASGDLFSRPALSGLTKRIVENASLMFMNRRLMRATLRERRERSAAIRSEIQNARERLSVALKSMNYGVALACQLEIDRLQKSQAPFRRGEKSSAGPTATSVGPQRQFVATEARSCAEGTAPERGLTSEERQAVIAALKEKLDRDRYPLAPLRGALAKLDPDAAVVAEKSPLPKAGRTRGTGRR